jgi:azurin
LSRFFVFAIAQTTGSWNGAAMNLRLLLSTALVAIVASGCGQKDASTTSSSTSGSTAAAAPAAPAAARTVEITAGDNMKFSIASIEAKPGEELKVVLTNIGTQPKEVMGHNWVLLKLGTDTAAFSAAAAASKATDYIPEALKDQIVVHTALLGPRKSDEVTFKAPTAPGEYPFLCTFPAHYQVGMKGVLVVK